MSSRIALIFKPWTFTNNTETADATKVNANFDTIIAALNEMIAAWNTGGGTQPSTSDRLGVSINPDGTINAASLPIATFDARSVRQVTDDYICLAGDSILHVTAPCTITLGASPVTIINGVDPGGDVTIMGPAGTTVLGEASIVIMRGEWIGLYPFGTDYWRFR